ncbi:MAG: hypothetical protein IMF12_10875, partial [Proteobacteria bacterium]|nr:hypothetical protein [Pseudomonadota bacterium]
MSPTSEEKPIITGRIKPLVAILKHKWLVLFIIILVIGLGIPATSKLGSSSYKSKAIILISPRFIRNLTSKRGMDLGRIEYNLYIKQQINMIERDDILQEVLQIPEVQKQWVRNGETINKAVKRLQKAIVAKNKRGTPFLKVSLSDNKPKNLDIILNSVITIYLKKNKAETLYDSDGRIVRLKQRNQSLESLVASKRKRRTKIAEELGVTTFQTNSLNPYDDILIESTSTFMLSQRKLVETET